MKSFSVPRVVVLGYFGLLFLLSALRGWQAYRIASTPVECTEGPCDAGVDYAMSGMTAGGGTFAVTFMIGVMLFAIGWGVYKATSKPQQSAG